MQPPSFFDPPSLAAHADVYKTLRVLPPQELFDFLWRVRRGELAENALGDEMLTGARQRFLEGLDRFGFPLEKRETLTEQHLHAILYETPLAMTYMMINLTNDRFFKENVVWHGKEHLDEARAQGSGAVLVQPHWGSFQLIFPALIASGYPTLQAFGDPAASEWAKSLSRAYLPDREGDVSVTSVGKDSVIRSALRALKQNHFFCIPFEISLGAKPEFQSVLLGQTVSVPEGPYMIAGHAGAPVMAISLELQGPNVHVHVSEPVRVLSRAKGDIQRAIEHIYGCLARMLQAKPYMWRGWHFLDQMMAPDQNCVKGELQ